MNRQILIHKCLLERNQETDTTTNYMDILKEKRML